MKDLPRKPIGHGPQVKFLSDIVDCLEERTPLKTDLYELDQTTKGWRIKASRGRGSGGSLEQRMIIKSIHDDWFRCLPYDKDGQHPDDAHATDADFILVAKPFELRFTDWDGQTVDGITYDYSTPDMRTATKGAIVEQHVVVRPWYVGEIIIAVNQVNGGTDATDDSLADILWEDTNSAAHCWAMVDINDTGGITPQSLNVRSVSALLPILSTGGTRPQISMAPSGVTAGDYGDAANVPTFTVDAFGRLTAAANVPIVASDGPPTGRWDYNGITVAHTSRMAWKGEYGSPTVVALATLLAAATEFTDGEYATLWAEDSTGTDFTTITGGLGPFFIFKLLINAQPAATKISPRAVFRMGVGETDPVYLHFWTGAAWEGVVIGTADEDNWVAMSGPRTLDLDDVIDSNGFLYVLISTSSDRTLGIDYLAIDIEGAAAPNGEAGTGGGGGMGGTVSAGYYARSDGVDLEDGNIFETNTATLQGTYVAGIEIVEGLTLFGNEFTLTADDMTITQGSSRLVLSSDDAVAANRTFHLADGGGGFGTKNDGFRLLLQWRGANAGELLAADTNVNLPGGDWRPADGEFLEVIWDVPTTKWIELWRRP